MCYVVPVGMAGSSAVGQSRYHSLAPAMGQVSIMSTTSNMQQAYSGCAVDGNPLKVSDASGMQQSLPRTDGSVNGPNQQQQSARAAVSLPSQDFVADSSASEDA